MIVLYRLAGLCLAGGKLPTGSRTFSKTRQGAAMSETSFSQVNTAISVQEASLTPQQYDQLLQADVLPAI